MAADQYFILLTCLQGKQFRCDVKGKHLPAGTLPVKMYVVLGLNLASDAAKTRRLITMINKRSPWKSSFSGLYSSSASNWMKFLQESIPPLAVHPTSDKSTQLLL